MNLDQDKLTKNEWESIEIPSNEDEIEILKLLIKGYDNVNIIENNTQTILTFLKISESDIMHNYIFTKYIQPDIIEIYKKYNTKYKPIKLKEKSLSKADIIRFQNMESNLVQNKNIIFEYKLLEYINNILKYQNTDTDWIDSFYVLKIISNYKIKNINPYLIKIIDEIFNYFDEAIDKEYIINNIKNLSLINPDIIKYNDKKLFQHQKELFTISKIKIPKLIFYTAPTGTGKTLSPIGLLQENKVIFVCAVRHVGLALAKAAITMQKCVAFAFGCNSVDDIRLHYYSAKEYVKNNKTGGIFKVDNSVGDKVELMICDIKSYLHAMYYMLAFHAKNNLILYWDEPTITLDYNEHPFHKIIGENWKKNVIPNIILSSATLPSINDLKDTVIDYKSRFDGETHNIESFDYRKSISLVNRDGYVVMPHNISNDYHIIKDSVNYIEKNKTILRYLDIDNSIDYINYINKKKLYKNDIYSIDNYFCKLEDITIETIKEYYLLLLKNIKKDRWSEIYNYFNKNQIKKYNSTVNISTSDAHTLNNGPTMYICEDVNKISLFCLQSLQIPDNILKIISKTIDSNSNINEKILVLEKAFEDGIAKEDIKENKMSNNRGLSPELRDIKNKLDSLKDCIKNINLPDIYVPNKLDHLVKWSNKKYIDAFTSDISEYTVEQVMLINDIEDIWKLLLLLGIGVFSNHTSTRYIEIMKDLAKNKKLYLIIATSDYIYGTNYQFDHCYLGKDLLNMTGEKIIQALGRVGRSKISDNYTIRIRENEIIKKIFLKSTYTPEVTNMQKLFIS